MVVAIGINRIRSKKREESQEYEKGAGDERKQVSKAVVAVVAPPLKSHCHAGACSLVQRNPLWRKRGKRNRSLLRLQHRLNGPASALPFSKSLSDKDKERIAWWSWRQIYIAFALREAEGYDNKNHLGQCPVGGCGLALRLLSSFSVIFCDTLLPRVFPILFLQQNLLALLTCMSPAAFWFGKLITFFVNIYFV